jgi:hypothetical protein
MPRTVTDTRTTRSLPARPGPASEQDTYALLTQLAREKQRLLGEQDLWQRKLQRITARLAEIDSHTQRLRQHTPHTPSQHTPPTR